MIATVISYPNNNIDYSFELGESSDSAELVQNILIDASEALDDEFIEVTYNDETITLLLIEECRYTPIDIFYQNKEGAVASFTFIKRSVETMDVTSEQFESDRGQPLFGHHEYTTFNVQAKSKFSVNTGFIDEENNEVIKQMLLSERLWKYENEILIPLTIESKNIEYKTQANDKVINYTINFAYAFNEVNDL
jgi:hypothetical protein